MSEPFTILLTATTRRALAEKLPETVAAAVAGLIFGALRDNPHRVGRRLQAPFEGLFAARRGTYRVLYRIDDEHRTVTVVDIRHRVVAYRAAD